ncbi:MAG: T9SS type A sorting domain-containing protein [Candidatus Kapabacteria bacterium]|nr:T9SS type A sorting domain-containing protein [Candidatus Kapabacteria bacterium]
MAQQRSYYSNLDYRFCLPSSVVEHNGAYFATFSSGDAIRFSSNEIQPRRVNVPAGRHAQRFFSSHNLLWLKTAAGSLFKSSDAGGRWILHDTAVTAASVLANGDLIYASGMVIRKVTGSSVTIDVMQFAGTRPGGITGVSMKGDTLVVHQYRDSVVTIHWGTDNALVSLKSMYDGIQFYSLGDSTLTFSETTAGSFHIQRGPLREGFFNATAAAGFINLNSVSVGRDSVGKMVVLLSGFILVNSTFSSRVAVVGPQYGRSYYDTRIDTASAVGGATIVGDTLVTLHSLGIVSISSSGNTQTSNTDFQNVSERLGWVGYDLLNPAIVYTNYTRLSSPSSNISFIHRNGISQAIVADNQSPFLDSIGSIAYSLEYEDGHMVFSGNKGKATFNNRSSTSRVSVRFSSYDPMHVTEDGSLVIVFGRGALLLSKDRGVTWKQHELSPRIPGFYSEADDFKNWYILQNNSPEIVFIDKSQNEDTLQYISFKLDLARGTSRYVGQQNGKLIVAQRYTDTTTTPASTTLKFYHFASPREYDTTIVTVPVTLKNSFLSYFVHGDTISVFERETTRIIRIADGKVVADSNVMTNGLPGFWGTSTTRAWFLTADTIVYQGVNEGHWCKLVIGAPFTTSVVEQDIEHFYFQNVHPNPASNKLTVDLGRFVTADISNVQLFLADMTGQTVKQFSKDLPKFTRANEVVTFDLDLSAVPSGAYLLVIRNSQITSSIKVIVSR